MNKSNKSFLFATLLQASLLLFAQGASAQGLGEITLQSSLNEPLLATIDLLDVSGLNADQIVIAIAGVDEYRQAGLDRNELLGRIKFSIELFPLGRGLLTLTTEERVDEPFLSVLLSARWSTGRVLREYTLLLDLPTFSENSAGQAPVTAPQTAATAASRPDNTATTASNNAATFTVESGDSLWVIAEQTRPSSDVSVQQMMIAIQRANEDAFVNNNINRLLNGRVLRIPNQQEIGIIGHSAAVAQINAQNQQMGLMQLGNTATGNSPATARDELTVLTGNDAQASGAGSSDLQATIAALENELMLSEEDLDRSRLENEELTAQLGDLEQQIDILQNIIAIEDDRIAQLQADLTEQAEATDQALAEAARAAQLLTASEAAQPQGMVARILTLLQNNLILIGGALAVVLAVLGLLVLKSRRNPQDDDDLDFTREQNSDPVRGASPVDDEPEPGFLAKLLSRFRGNSEDDDEDYEGDEDDAQEFEPESLVNDDYSDASDMDDDSDDMDDDSDDMDDDQDYEDDEDDGDDDAEVLASSVMDEVESSLDQVDNESYDPISAFEESELEAADVISLDDEDLADDMEFDLPEDDAETVQFSVASADVDDAESPTTEIAEEETEAFEFALKSEPQVEDIAVTLDDEPEAIESLDFNLTKAAAPAAVGSKSDAAAGPEALEKVEFAVSKQADDNEEDEAFDLDLGSLSFDENDAKADDGADDEESGYQARTNMDECDTKLDLAVAYEAMGDVNGAMEILEEVIVEGKPAQIEEATRLKTKWQDS